VILIRPLSRIAKLCPQPFLLGRLAQGEPSYAIHVFIRTRIAGLGSPCASRPRIISPPLFRASFRPNA